jgi:hypothetical protein
MPQFEYRVLRTKVTLRGSAWYAGEERLGGSDELEEILNRLGAAGWEVVGISMGMEFSRVILKRPRQGGEVAPSALPEGRGDEVAALPGSG